MVPFLMPSLTTSCMVSGTACSLRTGQGRGVSRSLARAAAVADRRVTELSREVLAELVVELGPRWQARQRALGAGARHRLVLVDRLLATLVHLCHGVTHDVLACWSSTTSPSPADRSALAPSPVVGGGA